MTELEKELTIRVKRLEDDCKAYNFTQHELQEKNKELEAQIEKMKCCGYCAKRGHICEAEEMQGKLCGKNKDKWELRR